MCLYFLIESLIVSSTFGFDYLLFQPIEIISRNLGWLMRINLLNHFNDSPWLGHICRHKRLRLRCHFPLPFLRSWCHWRGWWLTHLLNMAFIQSECHLRLFINLAHICFFHYEGSKFVYIIFLWILGRIKALHPPVWDLSVCWFSFIHWLWWDEAKILINRLSIYKSDWLSPLSVIFNIIIGKILCKLVVFTIAVLIKYLTYVLVETFVPFDPFSYSVYSDFFSPILLTFWAEMIINFLLFLL